MRIFFETAQNMAQNNHAMRNHDRRGSSMYVIKYVFLLSAFLDQCNVHGPLEQ